MIIKVTNDLALESGLITQIHFNKKDGSIDITLSSGEKWNLYGRSMRYFNKLIKDIQEIKK